MVLAFSWTGHQDSIPCQVHIAQIIPCKSHCMLLLRDADLQLWCAPGCAAHVTPGLNWTTSLQKGYWSVHTALFWVPSPLRVATLSQVIEGRPSGQALEFCILVSFHVVCWTGPPQGVATAAGVFTSRSGTGEGLVPGYTGWRPELAAAPPAPRRSLGVSLVRRIRGGVGLEGAGEE